MFKLTLYKSATIKKGSLPSPVIISWKESSENPSIHLSSNGLIMYFSQSQSFGFEEPRYFSMDSFLCSGSRLQKHPCQSKYMIEKIAS